MKTSLKISLLLNLGLLAGLILLAWQAHPHVSPSPPSVSEVKVSTPTTVAAALRVEREPFHWSQLDSTNYHTFVKNLRAVGCPEPTVRAIVTDDVNRRYDAQYQQLAQQLTALATNSWSVQLASNNVELALKARLQQLPDEENAEIADLLGLKPASNDVAGAAAQPAASSRIPGGQAQPSNIAMPLIFQNVDPQILNLNPDQMQAIVDLRRKFWDLIGGPNQDPSDPAYQERWQKAQPEMDSLLRSMIGTTAFQRYQINAFRAALAGSAK
jgi:hypothetical protein